jgi:hypothetical protein
LREDGEAVLVRVFYEKMTLEHLLNLVRLAPDSFHEVLLRPAALFLYSLLGFRPVALRPTL